MEFILNVTVTGADDGTSLDDMLRMANKYPFVEFGILLSRNSMGSTRFPSREWLRSAVEKFRSIYGIGLSGHICGSWVREILMGKWPTDEWNSIHPEMMDLFDRFQLNTHGIRHEYDVEKLKPILFDFESAYQSVILQYDNANSKMVEDLRHHKNIETLFDLSHGAGVLPKEWPLPIDGIRCGYAGGLSPENAAEEIRKISALIPEETKIWIDAETRLRDGEDRFSMEKVEEFLKASLPYVDHGSTQPWR